MAGALTHIVAGLILALIIYLMHFKFKFYLAAFIGSLLSDGIKLVVSAIIQLTFNVLDIMRSTTYLTLKEITSNPVNWALLSLFVFALLGILYRFNYFNKKQIKEYAKLYLFLLIGVILHLILDVFVQETNIWI